MLWSHALLDETVEEFVDSLGLRPDGLGERVARKAEGERAFAERGGERAKGGRGQVLERVEHQMIGGTN